MDVTLVKCNNLTDLNFALNQSWFGMAVKATYENIDYNFYLEVNEKTGSAHHLAAMALLNIPLGGSISVGNEYDQSHFDANREVVNILVPDYIEMAFTW